MSESPMDSPRPAIASLADPSGDPSLDFPVNSRVVGIGQGQRNEVVLEDDSVSTNHARLEYVDGEWRISDLDSKNGTYVDGVRLTRGASALVTDGAELGFGAVRLAFHANPAVSPEGAGPSEPYAAPISSRQGGGFRLPVWVFLLVILVIALVVFLLVTLAGDPGVTEPLPSTPTAALLLPHVTTLPGIAA